MTTADHCSSLPHLASFMSQRGGDQANSSLPAQLLLKWAAGAVVAAAAAFDERVHCLQVTLYTTA